jgi:transcriptional regulator with XRE-family HTH domain
MKNRLKKAVNYLKLEDIIKNQEDLAEKLGYDKASVSQALNGSKKYLTDSFIAKFCKKFNVINYDWLLTGEGDMLRPNVNIGHSSIGDHSPIIGDIRVNECKAELEKANLKIAYLEQMLKDKEEIIELLKSKI